MNIQISHRKSKLTYLKNYCHLAGENDTIDIVEWENGEGVDISIISKHKSQHFSLTYGEFQALQVLMMYQEKEH